MIHESDRDIYYQYLRGIILFDIVLTCSPSGIYNPTTRQYLPLPMSVTPSTYFLGYDPLKNQYKVLSVGRNSRQQVCQVYTLGDKYWRNIQGTGHCRLRPVVCINGFIYYKAKVNFEDNTHFLMSFDVRSEKFDRVQAPETLTDWNSSSTLVNYQGKVGFICYRDGVEIWVMDDSVKKQEWSKIIFYEMDGFKDWHIGGVTHDGGIFFMYPHHIRNKFCYLLCYDPRRNSVTRTYVDIEGIEDVLISIVPDHVENTMRLY